MIRCGRRVGSGWGCSGVRSMFSSCLCPSACGGMHTSGQRVRRQEYYFKRAFEPYGKCIRLPVTGNPIKELETDAYYSRSRCTSIETSKTVSHSWIRFACVREYELYLASH